MTFHDAAMPATIGDIAKSSGYSPATISRVINGVDGVRPEVRAEVERIAKELGYVGRRNRSPRSPAGSIRLIEVILHRRTGTERLEVGAIGGLSLGPLLPADEAQRQGDQWIASNDFYRKMLDGIMHQLRDHDGKAVLQMCSDLDDPALIKGLGSVEGVLLVGEDGPGLQRFLDRCPVPVVLVDILDERGRQEQVTSDNFGGIGLAVRHLVDLGHRQLGFISGTDVVATRERAEAFLFHAARLGATVVPGWSEVPYHHIEPTAQRLVPLLRDGPRPTGLCCCSDSGALAVLRAAERCGLRVPTDLSVVGFDDTDVASLVTPALTSVRTGSEALGRMAVRLLLTQGDRPERGSVVRLPCALVPRASTASPT